MSEGERYGKCRECKRLMPVEMLNYYVDKNSNLYLECEYCEELQWDAMGLHEKLIAGSVEAVVN